MRRAIVEFAKIGSSSYNKFWRSENINNPPEINGQAKTGTWRSEYKKKINQTF